MSKKWIIVALFLCAGAAVALSGVYSETGVDNTDGEWFALGGTYVCLIWSASWDGAAAGLETLMTGTRTTPTGLKDVGVAGLVGLTSGTLATASFETLKAGKGDYRLKVAGGSGSESINWECRTIPGG